MTNRVVVLAALVAACGGKDPPAASRTTTNPEPVVPVAAAAAFPTIETACTTDEDCTITGRWSTCCGVCEQKYASKAYVAKVDAFCEAHPASECPPMGCSWGMTPVGCVEGVCAAKLAKRNEPTLRAPKTSP